MSDLVNTSRWRVLQPHLEVEKTLVESCGISQLAARIMAARGITSIEQAQSFLHPDLAVCWEDPFLIPGMQAACERVAQAIATHEKIAVFGDFDVDGMSSTCLLTLALRKLGANCDSFIPHRFDEGYGLSKDALERVIEQSHPDLIITVDNGISAAREVAWIVEQGIDVVITDHHEPADQVPQGVPVANPKLNPACISRNLAGAGVALKLVTALGRHFGMPELWREFSDIATLGTISDMMLLVGENRALVKDGIERLQNYSRPGLRALAAAASVDIHSLTADSLPFSLVPRLNAAGRMGSTDIAFNLLLTDDEAEAQALATRLETINNERRDIEAALTKEAMEMVEATYSGQRVIVVAGEGWHEGVKGIVASRIVNRYQVPVILFSISDGVARGSGRSVGSVDLFHATELCQDLLIRFGGHAGAVGVTLDVANIDAFRERLETELNKLDAKEFVLSQEVSAVVPLSDLTLEQIQSLDVLRPFGQGNKRPLLASTGVIMKDRMKVGATQDHLHFCATDGQNYLSSIMFRVPDIDRAAQCDEVVDLVFDAVVEEWQGVVKPKLMVKDILYHSQNVAQSKRSHKDPSEVLVEDLFEYYEQSAVYADEYDGIAEADSFITKVVGVSFEGRQDVVAGLAPEDELELRRDSKNSYDANAIQVLTKQGEQLGFVRKQIAAAIAPVMDGGVSYSARVLQVTGDEGQTKGINIRVYKTEVALADVRESNQNEEIKEALADQDFSQVTNTIRKALIADHSLLPAQAAALDNLAQGKSTMCVMATGRGKSLIFHIHAAREALVLKRMSIFVFPLRALVADQIYHLEDALSQFGIVVKVMTGETSQTEREELCEQMRAGRVDIVLTTPEFLALHTDYFAQTNRCGFVVIDEAHHAGVATAANRSSYTELPRILDQLGNPCVLAVSATADDEVAKETMRLASIDPDCVILDKTCRENLSIVDVRNFKNKDDLLTSVVATGEKCVCYVNSREQTISLAKMLRKRIPDLAHKIAFYNAGLTKKDRGLVEQAFRSSRLSCIVSTSAFGEGVNLPDIRNVMLYHMPFDEIEYNQMSGRAGRDGKLARVFMMFGYQDAGINERILQGQAPQRSELIALYRTLMQADEKSQGESFIMPNADIAEVVASVNPRVRIDDRAVSYGIGIFKELGFLTTSGYGTARRIAMIKSPKRVDLQTSIRYLEGCHALEAFDSFKNWALTSSAQELLDRINRPITPSFGREVD